MWSMTLHVTIYQCLKWVKHALSYCYLTFGTCIKIANLLQKIHKNSNIKWLLSNKEMHILGLKYFLSCCLKTFVTLTSHYMYYIWASTNIMENFGMQSLKTWEDNRSVLLSIFNFLSFQLCEHSEYVSEVNEI